MDDFVAKFRQLFGVAASVKRPLTESGAAVRCRGIDVRSPLTPEQADFLFDALSQFRILCLAGQDLESFSLAHFERFTNH